MNDIKNNNSTINNISTMSNEEKKDKIMNIASNNLDKLMKLHKLSPDDLAKEIDVHVNTIKGYQKCDRLPSIDFLIALKNRFDISIDDFLTKEFSQDDIYTAAEQQDNSSNNEDLSFYYGSYYSYYLDNESPKGKEMHSSDKALTFGLLYIYEESSPLIDKKEVKCFSIFGVKDKEIIHNFKAELDRFDTGNEALLHASTSKDIKKHLYLGDIDFSDDHIFVSLEHKSNDRVLIAMRRPKSNKPAFLGGLGTINSISRGVYKNPVVQLIGFSRYSLDISSEDIHEQLIFNTPHIDENDDVDELINTFNNLYNNEESTSFKLDDIQKKILIKSNVERIVIRSLVKNIMRYGKVTWEDDNDWYHIIKHHSSEKLYGDIS